MSREAELGGGDAVIEVPMLFQVLTCDDLRARPARYSLAGLDRVEIGRGPFEPVCVTGGRIRIGVDDPRMSTVHASLVREVGAWLLCDAGSKNGTFVNGRRRTTWALREGDVIELGHTFFLFRSSVRVHPEDPAFVERDAVARPATGLVTLVPALARAHADLVRVARASPAVLVLGETGTGKELVARAVHQLSRRPGELVAVNCGALPPTLIEGELFGSRRGAYSGAVADRPGLIVAADRGTLFLDEVGDLERESQAALLRVLQEREVRPVGDTRSVAVDLRLVSATHHDLPAAVAAGRFRADLHARLSGFVVELPPLRERREDLGLVVAELASRLAPERRARVAVHFEVARAWFAHRWPGNVRELEKCLESAMSITDDLICLEHLPAVIRTALADWGRAPAGEGPSRVDEPVRRTSPEQVSEITQERVIALLVEHGGNLAAVARTLGTSRSQLHRLARRFAIDLGAYRR